MAKLMVNKPIQIPGIALPVGTYWLVLLDSPANHNMVQILSADRSKVYATMFTVPTSREQPTDRAEIKIAERPHQQTEALMKWYYPSLLSGHEFLYPNKEETELARDAKADVIAQSINVASNTTKPGA